jgi:hypothetical protein
MNPAKWKEVCGSSHSRRATCVSIYGIAAALTGFPSCVRATAYVGLKPEQDTTLHVGERAVVRFGLERQYSIGSGGGSLVLVKQLTDKDGRTVYVYRAAHVGPDTLVAAPVDIPAGGCISCVTVHYFIKVVP